MVTYISYVMMLMCLAGWRDVESIDSRASSYDAHHLCDIISKMKKQRALVVDLPDGGHTAAKYSPQNQRKQSSSAPIIRGLRGLFSTALKFQKTLKRYVQLKLFSVLRRSFHHFCMFWSAFQGHILSMRMLLWWQDTGHNGRPSTHGWSGWHFYRHIHPGGLWLVHEGLVVIVWHGETAETRSRKISWA